MMLIYLSKNLILSICDYLRFVCKMSHNTQIYETNLKIQIAIHPLFNSPQNVLSNFYVI